MPDLHRRRFIAAAAALPMLARAQAAAAPRVGILSFEAPAGAKARVEAFRGAMDKLGRTRVDYIHRSAGGARERLQALAEALVKEKPDVIVSESALTTLPLRNATSSIPIVMAACDDPLASRFVRALDKPGGNVTGVAIGVRDELPVPVELLAMAMPKGARFAGIFNPSNAMYRKARAGLHYGAVQRGLQIAYLDALEPADIDAAFAAARAERVAGIVVMHDPFFVSQRARFVKLAAAARAPVVFPERSFVEAGGAISHGPSLVRAFARAAAHVDRILQGTPPGDIAVEGAGRYELVVSRKAPAAFIKRADAVL